MAYLSACHTARNLSVELLDESIHLAGAFHLAGFRGVVGTLWAVSDRAAVEIAADFYHALRNPSGALDPGRSALALHRAVRRQRDLLPEAPTVWAGHMHTGA